MNARAASSCRPRLRFLALAFLVALLSGTHARASVALLLEQPYGGMGAVNPTGHSALYFDHICAETPTQLRSCRPGELGAVISRYDDIDGYDWIAIPLLPYLYAVDSPDQVPGSVDFVAVARLRNAYRRAHLLSVAADDAEGRAPDSNWYELVGSAYDRTIYGFQVNSTREQDERLIALLNDRKNVQRYNGAFRNCADFTRVTLNRFYPHAIRRNFIADLGLSTPKSVARGLTRYSDKHPEVGLQVFVVPQVKGALPRSHHVQGVAESLLKRYGLPLTLISPAATGVVLVAYVGHGRFAMPKDAPVLDLSVAAGSEMPENVAPLQRQILLASQSQERGSENAQLSLRSVSEPAGLSQGATETVEADSTRTAGSAAAFPTAASGFSPDFNVPALTLPLLR